MAAWDGLRQLLSGARHPVYFTQAGGDPFNVAWHNLTLWAFLVAVVPALAGVLRRLPRGLRRVHGRGAGAPAVLPRDARSR